MKDDLKIAALVPVGPLDRMGYQYYWKDTLDNHSQSFDRVYVCTNLYENIGLEFEHDNIELVYHEDLLKEKDNVGSESYSQKKVKQAVEAGVEKIKNDGYDFIVMIMINNYIDKENMLKMRKYLQNIKQLNKPFGVYGRSFQIYDKICHPSAIMTYILNLNSPEKKEFSNDKIIVDNKEYPWINGLFLDVPFEIVDVYGEYTEKDFKEKHEWYIYQLAKDLNNSNETEFDFKQYISRLENMVSKLVINKRHTKSKVGNLIVSKYPKLAFFKFANIKYSYLLKEYLKVIINQIKNKRYRELLKIYLKENK